VSSEKGMRGEGVPINTTSNFPCTSLYELNASNPFVAVACSSFSFRIVAMRSLRFISLSSTRRTRRPCLSSTSPLASAGGMASVATSSFSLWVGRGKGIGVLGGERGVSATEERVLFGVDMGIILIAKSCFSEVGGNDDGGPERGEARSESVR
jgi:hypothetical protein